MWSFSIPAVHLLVSQHADLIKREGNHKAIHYLAPSNPDHVVTLNKQGQKTDNDPEWRLRDKSEKWWDNCVHKQLNFLVTLDIGVDLRLAHIQRFKVGHQHGQQSQRLLRQQVAKDSRDDLLALGVVQN